MQKFQCLLFVLNRSCICYYTVCMTVPLSKHLTCTLIATFDIIDNNYKVLIIFQQVDVYLNEPIKIDVLIKLANQSTQ